MKKSIVIDFFIANLSMFIIYWYNIVELRICLLF